MSAPLVWVHDDRLGRDNEALARHPTAPAVFVFDPALMRARGYGLKRIGFIYECLLELPLRILEGPLVPTLRAAARAAGAAQIVTVASPCPQLCQAMAALVAAPGLEILAPPAFVDTPERLDLRRFSRYWRAVRTDALRPGPR